MKNLEKKFSVGVIIGGQITHLPSDGNILMYYERAIQKAVQHIYSLRDTKDWKQAVPREFEFVSFENGRGDRITISEEQTELIPLNQEAQQSLSRISLHHSS